MKKLVTLLTLTAALACVDAPVRRMPNGLEVEARTFRCYEKPDCIYFDFADTQGALAKAWIPGRITYIGPVPKTYDGDVGNVTQVAVGGDGLLSGGSAQNNFTHESMILIKMKPQDARLPEYTMQVVADRGGVSPRVLLSMYKQGDTIRVLPFRHYAGDDYTLLRNVDVYTPESIRK